jgi:predicted SAM-dependent methyltransferase
MKTYLNLGCGSRYHPAWINIDIVPQAPGIIQYDLTRGIPLPDTSCDVVYHAAVLEHMRRGDALPFLRECYRVLKPSGIIRVGVPDLEKLCRLYLEKLEAALSGDENAANDYDWIMLELYDQTVREQSGGEMLAYLRQNPLPNEKFVYTRIGEEGRQLVQALRKQDCSAQTYSYVSGSSLFFKLRNTMHTLLSATKQNILWYLLGAEGMRALEIGRFRLAGEVHHWMYDRYSLTRLLRMAGFRELVVLDATTSRIPEWNTFYLDTLPDGTVIKPDLFFIEGIK